MADKKERDKTVLAGYAYFTFVHSPMKDEEYGDKYKTDLVIENEDGTPYVYTNPVTGEQVDMVKKCKELGFTIYEPTASIPYRYVSARAKSTWPDGKPRAPIPVVDKDKNPIDKATLIGNGSEVRVQVLINPYKRGVSIILDRMIVDNLVPYVSKKGETEFDFPHMRGTGKKASEATSDEDVPFEE